MSFTIIEQATPRLHRSELAVPGSNVGMFEKAARCAADIVFLDLEDAVAPDDKEKARLRKQALDWLRADLASRTEQLASGPPAGRATVQQMMRQWKQDPDLAGLRDSEALKALAAQERQACVRLWADVRMLLKKAQEKSK